MYSINVLSLSPDVNDWLANSRQPRILHVFDHASNLINERREVLSIVTQQIGNGPFNLVIEDDVLFSEHLNLQSLISVFPNQLNLGDLTINTDNTKLWSPRPDWEMLHADRDDILQRLMSLRASDSERSNPRHREEIASSPRSRYAPMNNTGLLDQRLLAMTLPQSPITNYQFSNSPVTSLLLALANADLPSSLTAAQQLAGLGIGLTPAGDDFLLGAVLAAWIIHPPEIAGVLAEEIANTAAPFTTSLSAAWLRSAGKGGAGILWHEFFDALISVDPFNIRDSMDKILAIGETSGADALAGFVGVFISWAESSGSYRQSS